MLARDGDTGRPRKLQLSLQGDSEELFELAEVEEVGEGVHRAVLKVKGDIDREKEVGGYLLYYIGQCWLGLLLYCYILYMYMLLLPK